MRPRKPLRCLILPVVLLWAAAIGPAHAQMVREDFDVTNGPVTTMEYDAGTLYVAGNFHQVGPVTGPAVPIDILTGRAEAGFPRVNGVVYAVASDQADGWYLGGSFSDVGGLARTNLAHVRADGTVSGWNPAADGTVRALLVAGGSVFVGGEFANVGGQARARVAALHRSTGLAKASWSDPGGNAIVRTLAVTGGLLYAGGNFTTLGGQPRSFIAALDTTTGLATSWNPGANGVVRVLRANGTTIYAGGNFTSIGGQTRNHLAALSTASNTATAWNPNANSTVFAIAVKGTTVFAGGLFTTMGGQSRNRVAEVSATTPGAVTSWNADADSTVFSIELTGAAVYAGGTFKRIGGEDRTGVAALDPVTGAALPFEANAWSVSSAAGNSVYALELSGTKLFVGSDAEHVGGKRRNYVAAIDVTTGRVTDWNPDPNHRVYALAVTPATVFIGGAFDLVNGQDANHFAEVSRTLGDQTDWTFYVSGFVKAVAVRDNAVHIGGNFEGETTSCWFRRPGDPSSETCHIVFGWDLAAFDTTTTHSGTPMMDDCFGCEVSYLKRVGITVFMSGRFDTVDDEPRENAASVDAIKGEPSDWAPNPNGPIESIVPRGSLVYVAGSFLNVGGQIRYGLAAVDALTGTANAWDPLPDDYVHALDMNPSLAFVGGEFTHIGGQPRNHLAAVDPVTGLASPWNPDANDTPRKIIVLGSTVFVGGDFTTIGGQARPHLVVMGTSTTVDVPAPAAPDLLTLRQNAPNPFTDRTTIRFTLAKPERVSLEVFDAAGRLVSTLLRDQIRPAGHHDVEFDAAHLQAGLYLYRLTLGDQVQSRKMLHLR